MVLESSGLLVLAHKLASFNLEKWTRESCLNFRKIKLPSSSLILNMIGNKMKARGWGSQQVPIKKEKKAEEKR
jgi:hypothetical protein